MNQLGWLPLLPFVGRLVVPLYDVREPAEEYTDSAS